LSSAWSARWRLGADHSRYEQRQDSDLSKIPVVVVSAKTDSAQHAAWLEADAYLEKPLSLGRLVEVVNRFCPSC